MNTYDYIRYDDGQATGREIQNLNTYKFNAPKIQQNQSINQALFRITICIYN